MIHAIVPVKNEGSQIPQTLDMLLSTLCDKIIVILNGCEDDSLKIVKDHDNKRIEYIYFNKALGIDIPRVVGAHMALKDNAKGVVFVDGDMQKGIAKQIDEIIQALKKGTDMALTNCYPNIGKVSSTASLHLYYRKLLNLELGIYKEIGYSIPSHGPHGLSRRLLDAIELKELAIPPVSLALSAKNHFLIDAVTTIPVTFMPTTIRDDFHANQITKTIIGDCIEAIQSFKGEERTRRFCGVTFTGYHKNRRFDILDDFLDTF